MCIVVVAGAEDRKLFVGGLSWETKEPQLKEYFEKFGEIESVNLKLDPVTGRSRCFAFMVFKESSSVDQVLLPFIPNLESNGFIFFNKNAINIKSEIFTTMLYGTVQ